MTTKTAKVTKGSLVLPRELLARWENADVLIVPDEDTIIVKRMEKPLQRLTELMERVSSPTMTNEEIVNEIAAYRADV